MSNDVVEKNGLSLPEIEKILQRKDSNKKVPPQLRSQALHQLYKDIKLPYYKDPHKLNRFDRWEKEVSKRIAKKYFNYKQASFDIKSFKSKSNKRERSIYNKARAIKSQISSREIDKVRDYFKNTSHAWLIESASYRKKDHDSFRKFISDYPLTDEYLKKTYKEVCRKAKKKKYEGAGQARWEKIHEETKELTDEEVRIKFCDEFGEEYWEKIHKPYLKEIREVTNAKAGKMFYEEFDEEYWEVIRNGYLKEIRARTKKKAGKKYCEAYDKKFWKVSRRELDDVFRDELEEIFPKIYLAHRKPRVGSYSSDNAFVMNQYYSRSKKGIVHLVRMLHRENDIPSNEIDLVYPFLNINRLVLYFWLEQIELILSPNMILAELKSDKNIGKNELDVFLIWAWEIVHNTKAYKKINTRKYVKIKIIQLLTSLYYQALGKKPLKVAKATDKKTILHKDYIRRQRWEKFRWMKNNAKNARLKPLLDKNKTEEEYKILKKLYHLPDRKRLKEMISNQSKS